MWTAGWVEPGDKWMVTIIPLSSAPNPWVGPLTVQCRALTMVRFVGEGHLNDQNSFLGQILVRHLSEKSDICSLLSHVFSFPKFPKLKCDVP